MTAFSVASLAALAWLIVAYEDAPHLPTWGMLEWWKPVMLALMLVSAAGTRSIDAKRRRALGGPTWDGFAARTPIVPFAAILQRQARMDLRGIGIWRLPAGVAAYALMLGGFGRVSARTDNPSRSPTSVSSTSWPARPTTSASRVKPLSGSQMRHSSLTCTPEGRGG